MSQLIDLLAESKIRVLRLRLTLEAARTAVLPEFLGSTLRGAFGKALKPKACPLSSGECRDRCLEPACRYRILFEGNPSYVIRSSPSAGGLFLERGGSFSFEFLLFGPAVSSAWLVCAAMYDAGRTGFGYSRVPFHLIRLEIFTGPEGWQSVELDESPNLDARSYSLIDLVNLRLTELAVDQTLRVRFPTRLRREVSGREQFQANPVLPFPLFVSMVSNRIAALSESFGTKIDSRPYFLQADVESVAILHSNLEFMDLERFSNRHMAHKKIGGLHGEIIYRGNATRELLPLLVAGEIVHIGSQTSMGLGLYELSPE